MGYAPETKKAAIQAPVRNRSLDGGLAINGALAILQRIVAALISRASLPSSIWF
jgi:hypothetical protein